MQERWLSVDGIAAHLGFNPDTICMRIDARTMPAHKVGRLWKLPASEPDRLPTLRQHFKALHDGAHPVRIIEGKA